ncbi:hypothetical protein NVP1276O_59 [Vibrio phage 1.276.O._10N.286.54.E4]|nr:hypothetical protein NVP1276O_59 [Vibrio phage 1.276.O._10N.286.54.E4]
MAGWISLHRSITKHWLWDAEEFSKGQAWVDLLLNANHKPATVMIKGKVYKLERGQQCRSMLTLAKQWKWSRGKVKRFIDALKSDSMLDIKTDTYTSVITICNYSDFQGDDTTGSTTGGHQTDIRQDTNNNVNNGNNENKSLVKAEPKRSKFKFSDDDLRFAGMMFDRVLVVTPSAKKPNLENWANTIRLMRESDNRDHKTMWAVFDWANRDSFWCSNILSPDKLRKQFDKLQVKKNETNQPRNATTGRKLSAVEENNARLLAKYGNPAAPSERTINPAEHTGMDSYKVSGGVQQQVAAHGVTLDMDAGDFSDDSEGDPQFRF